MTPENPGLARTQRWLQKFIMAPGTDAEAIASPKVTAEIGGSVGDVVTASKMLTPEQRAGIYRGMYLARLGEALEKDYPALRGYLGRQRFERVVAGYVAAYPSRSYTLNRLGERLPRYLAELPKFDEQDLVRDIARFELLVSEVFDEAEDAPIEKEVLDAVPPDEWDRAVLRPIRALRLGQFDYPVDQFKEAQRDEKDYPAPSPRQTSLAIYRRSYTVYWQNLSAGEQFLLERLTAGETLGAAVERSFLERGVAEEQLFQWFQAWIRNGLFRAVELTRR